MLVKSYNNFKLCNELRRSAIQTNPSEQRHTKGDFTLFVYLYRRPGCKRKLIDVLSKTNSNPTALCISESRLRLDEHSTHNNTFLVNFPRWMFNFTASALSICLKQPKNAMKLLLSFYFNLYLLLHAWWTQAQMCLAKDIYSTAVKLQSRCGKASRNFHILLYKKIFIDVWNFPVQILSLHCQWWECC